MSTRFVAAWLASQGQAEALLPPLWRTPEGRRAAVQRAARRSPPAPATLAALRAQHEALPPSDARAHNLDRLAKGAACVVTGQQVGLFLGPLYSFFKAMSAILIARELEAEAGHPVVPVFWLQAEDHDLDEIATAWTPGADGSPVALRLQTEPGWRTSVAHRALGDDAVTALRGLEELLGDRPFAAEALALLQRHYQPGRSVAAAYAGAIAEVFAEEGLIVLQPRTEAFARLAAPVHRRALQGADELDALLARRAEALAEAGLEVQIEPREGCTLSFFHPEGPSGPRHRLRRCPQGGWTGAGHPMLRSEAELERTLERRPLRWSTSALLRPILQDTLLPTAAYVGGPGEVCYFGQLAPVYAWFGLPAPMIVHRGRGLLIEPDVQAALRDLGLTPRDLERDEAELLERVRIPEAPEVTPERLRDALEAPLLDGLASIWEDAAALDPTMERTLRGARHVMQRQINRLVRRAQVSRLASAPERQRALKRVQGMLRPDGGPQERTYGLAWFLSGCGLEALKREVRAAFEEDVWSPEVKEVAL